MEAPTETYLKKCCTLYFAFHHRFYVDPRLSTVLISQILVWQMPVWASLEGCNLKNFCSIGPTMVGPEESIEPSLNPPGHIAK